MNDALELPDLRDLSAIGQPLRRKEDERLLTARGRFSDDLSLPGQGYAAIVRSPYPHARILGIDTRRAAAMPGVLESGVAAALAHDGPVTVDAVVNRQELAMLPAVTVEMAEDFSLFMVKAVLSGRANELIELARSNFWR